MAPGNTRLYALALIAAGGFVGANARSLVASLLPEAVAVLAANVFGSFLLGALVYEAEYTDRLESNTRRFLTTGVLSSFTTYSTFALLSATASPLRLVGYVVATYGLGFAGVFAGRALAGAFRDRRVGA